ncbi:MAG: glycosyltransferase family 39 protein [Chitinophagales bacterium]|nr:glycosyltransferase family 39 protein [Chitinophagales bacterium]
MRNKFIIPACFAVIKFFISVLGIHHDYDLHRDEFLYLAEARHLAWGYNETAPLLPFLGRISLVFGNWFYLVKFWPALLGALTILILGAIVIRLGGKGIAQVIACSAFLFSAYLRIHILFQPNILDIFFWTLIAYALIAYFQTQENKWMYIAGVSLGLALLSKYMVVIFIASLFLAVALTKQRRLLLNKHLWFSLGITCIIFLPNLLWQAQHDFPALGHVEELKETQLKLISPFTFLVQQFLLLVNSLPVWLLGLWFFVRDKKSFSFITVAYFIMLLLFTVTGGKDYYTMGFYPVLLAGGGVWIEQHTARRKWIRYALLILIIFPAPFAIPVMMPCLSPAKAASFYARNNMQKVGMLQWEDGKDHALPQDFADMLGWEEMAVKTANIYTSLPDSVKKNTMVYCYNYGEAGALMWYSKKYPLPDIISRSSSFMLWYPKQPTATSLIIISDDESPHSTERVQLSNIELKDSVTNPLAREYGTKIYMVGKVKYLGR